MQRELMLDQLRSGEVFDVLVIGGGATGLGTAVDAATRGYRVALIERDDFAKGTSSRSTKLVHGGVRYLRQGNVSLVHDALIERGRLLRNAPHLTRNLTFVIPVYSCWDRFFYSSGLGLYDWLAGEWSLGHSRKIDRAETLRLLPNVEASGLIGGVLYHDGQFDDARLAIHLAQTAVDHGAVVVNYCACTGLIKEGGRVVGVELRDRESGYEIAVRAKVVVNATGVFVDEVRSLDDVKAQPLVTVSQGAHLVLPKRFMSGEAAMMVPKTADGRVLFAVPWHDCVIVGTTDTPVAGAVKEPRVRDEERSFLMEHAGQFLADDPLPDDVLSVFAGLRPLVRTKGSGHTASLSRDHTLEVGASGLITVTGGKWTTYRKMGEDVINRAATIGGLIPRTSRTADLKLHGWQKGVELEWGYGADAVGIRALGDALDEWKKGIHPQFNYTVAEVIWQVRHEMARTVEDVLARRTRALLCNARASIEAASCVARLLASELKRDEAWVERQIDDYTRLARGYVFTDPLSRSQSDA